MAVSLTSSGLAMPASQSASGNANTLDDYEEGTWTVTITPSTSGSHPLFTEYDAGQYTVIGNLCFATCRCLTNTASSPVGELKFSLPFTAAASTADVSGSYFGQVYHGNGLNFAADSYMMCSVLSTWAYVKFTNVIDSDVSSNLSGSAMPNGQWFGFSIVYNI